MKGYAIQRGTRLISFKIVLKPRVGPIQSIVCGGLTVCVLLGWGFHDRARSRCLARQGVRLGLISICCRLLNSLRSTRALIGKWSQQGEFSKTRH